MCRVVKAGGGECGCSPGFGGSDPPAVVAVAMDAAITVDWLFENPVVGFWKARVIGIGKPAPPRLEQGRAPDGTVIRLVDLREIVEHRVERHPVHVVLKCLRECVRQPGEPAHVHPYG